MNLIYQLTNQMNLYAPGYCDEGRFGIVSFAAAGGYPGDDNSAGLAPVIRLPGHPNLLLKIILSVYEITIWIGRTRCCPVEKNDQLSKSRL